jgi:hypothetical protein
LDIVDFIAVLIGAEGVKTSSKMQKPYFLLRRFFREDYSKSCGSSWTVVTPQEQRDDEAHRPAPRKAKRLVPGKEPPVSAMLIQGCIPLYNCDEYS